MKNWNKTRIFLIFLSLIIIAFAFIIQSYGASKVQAQCSYLDPILIDIFALGAALFLVIEGCYRIYIHRNYSILRQWTRITRVVFGFAIITLHIMQFLHK